MNLIKKLFNLGYLPYKKFNPRRKNKKILTDPMYSEFRKALLSEMAKKLAENYYYLSQPVKNLEMKGEYNAITRIYDDLINWFAAETKEEIEKYEDPLIKIEEEAKEAYNKRPKVEYKDPYIVAEEEAKEKVAKMENKA